MFSGGGKKDDDACQTPAHQAPAGGSSVGPNALEKFTTGEGAAGNVNETVTEDKFGSIDLTSWFADDKNKAKLDRRAHGLVDSCKVGFAIMEPAVLEAGVHFAEQSVELIKAASDDMEAVGAIMAAFGVELEVVKPLVSYLVRGEPPLAEVSAALLAGAVAVANSSDAKGEIVDAVKEVFMTMSPSSNSASDTTDEHSTIAYARGVLEKAPPDFNVEMNEELFGLPAVGNPPFALTDKMMPLDRIALQAAPLLASKRVSHTIKEALADKTNWPTSRRGLMNKLIYSDGGRAGSLVMQGECNTRGKLGVGASA